MTDRADKAVHFYLRALVICLCLFAYLVLGLYTEFRLIGIKPLPEKLIRVQQLMEKGDERAALIYQTIGVYFGHNVVQYMDMYALRSVLVLGRVLTGAGGNLILETAREVLKTEYPELRGKIRLVTPGEKEKRLGQAMAAASLPSII